MHTLLVEDNVSLAQTVIAYFDLEGIDCDYASTGSQGLELGIVERLPSDSIGYQLATNERPRSL
jgi:DNA-binding response OmpR family regulator